MLAEIFDLSRDSLAIFFSGLVIKLTDDYLDQTIDGESGTVTLAANLKEAVLPYTLVLYSSAILLNLKISLALFLGAYMVGMFSDLKRPLSFGLKGYQECLIVLILSSIFLGIKITLLSILVMLIIQITDDFLDLKEDKNRGSSNLVAKYGKIEMGIALTIFISLAMYLSVYYSILSMVIYPAVSSVFLFARGGFDKVC